MLLRFIEIWLRCLGLRSDGTGPGQQDEDDLWETDTDGNPRSILAIVYWWAPQQYVFVIVSVFTSDCLYHMVA